jgi:excisionase family DNA binding protein
MPNESLPSFLRRLVELNYYDSYGMLAQLIQERCCNRDKIELPHRAVIYREIARLTCITISEVHASSAHCFAEILTPPNGTIDYLNINEHAFPILPQAYAAKQLRPLNACQFCPKCLRESAYHRLIWLPVVVSACLQHSCLLVNRCPACQSNITIQCVVAARCSKCSADLSLAESVDLYDDGWGIFSQKLMQTWLMQEALLSSIDALLPLETPRVLYRVVDGLQWATRMLANTNWSYLHTVKTQHPDTKLCHRDNKMRNITPYESYSLYATACKGIIRWPHGLWDFLQEYRDHMRTIKSLNGGPKADLGILYSQWIQDYWQHSAFEFVHKAFKGFFIHTYSLSSAVLRTDLCRKNTKIAEEISYVSVTEAARLLRAAPKTIDSLLRRGELTCQIDRADKQKYRFLNREEVLALRNKWNETINCAEAAKYLGVTEKMIQDLVEVGLLTAERNPAEGYSHWAFSKWSLVNCMEQILRHVETYTEEDKKVAPLADLAVASRLLFVVGMNAASILARVAEGKLHACYLANRGMELRSLQFDCTDIQQCINTVKSENEWMSREELIQLLQVKDHTLARWVHTGLIPVATTYGNAQYFDQATVRRFMTDYITTEEAAKLLGIGKLAVQKWARQGRLSQVCVSGPHVDGHHAYLFNKEKLIQWRNERLTFGEAMQLLRVSKATLHRWIAEGKIITLDDMGGKQRWFSKQALLGVQSTRSQ